MATRGYVYVLSNPSMPGIVKIGRSINGGKSRARDLYQTGVPTPFLLEFELLSQDCVYVECAAHDLLSANRVSCGREFFRAELGEAMQAVMSAECDLMDKAIIDVECHEAVTNLAEIAYRIGAHPIEMMTASRFLTDEEGVAIYERYKAWIEVRLAEEKAKRT